MHEEISRRAQVFSLKIQIHLLSGQGQLLPRRQLCHFLLTGYGLCFCGDLNHMTGQIRPASRGHPCGQPVLPAGQISSTALPAGPEPVFF